ncbi:putative bacteriophage baseplate protein [Thermodesulfovibrio sp. N1]|uniref:GPW/gp25 family protein n=1 Tax=unclassified Thermodesulfovibrio TaxID=2645936 RepID=UPI00083B55BD|nr:MULTISPECIES: GPW/gp25 family protein [unclassified Thermodesulfovibrio]MDI1471937.1 GPW/gp25 family protein [Thermodesulfovibrio sp. 1176]ODA44240.1 putative bacteriophage baseplate protein [Thermodesulfovibrio sp. N1]
MKTIDNIESVDFQPKFGEIGEVVENIEDINQCIRIILSTPKRSDPHRPEFGSDIWKYIDYPVNEAIPNIIREAIDAVNTWEPRVEIKSIRAKVEQANVILQIEWVLKGSEEPTLLEVIV